MILSEYDRRWAEIRLYHFCLDMYRIRNKSIDIMDMVNMVCEISEIDSSAIKPIIQTMLTDTYYKSTKREIILIGSKKGLSAYSMGKLLGMTRQGVSKYLNRNEEEFSPLPRLNIDDDRLIIKFLITLDKLKDVGQLGYGTFN